jgi:hypothetical protein
MIAPGVPTAFGQLLKGHRQCATLSQEELAERVRLTRRRSVRSSAACGGIRTGPRCACCARR